MLNTVESPMDYRLKRCDGEIGRAKEFHVDDLHWTVRYLVAGTGECLNDTKVPISPFALDTVDKEKPNMGNDLARKRTEDRPSPETDGPVSRQFEAGHCGHSGYWLGIQPAAKQNAQVKPKEAHS